MVIGDPRGHARNRRPIWHHVQQCFSDCCASNESSLWSEKPVYKMAKWWVTSCYMLHHIFLVMRPETEFRCTVLTTLTFAKFMLWLNWWTLPTLEFGSKLATAFLCSASSGSLMIFLFGHSTQNYTVCNWFCALCLISGGQNRFALWGMEKGC